MRKIANKTDIVNEMKILLGVTRPCYSKMHLLMLIVRTIIQKCTKNQSVRNFNNVYLIH